MANYDLTGSGEAGNGLETVENAIRRSPVGRTKFYELVSQGVIETTHIGRKTLVRSESLDRYVDHLAGKPPAKGLGQGATAGERILREMETASLDGVSETRSFTLLLDGGHKVDQVIGLGDVFEGVALARLHFGGSLFVDVNRVIGFVVRA